MTPRRTLTVALAALIALAGASPALAQDLGTSPGVSASTEEADRGLFRRLTRQVQRVDRESEAIMERAMREAGENGGKANPETKARLLSLRDERDRLFSRLLLLSMRYGWTIPDFDRSAAEKANREASEDAIFGAVDLLVQRRFADQARRIVTMVRLPVVSLDPKAR